MTQTSRGFRFALLFLLSMTELMPVALLTTAMPVLLRRAGASMADIGMLSIVMIPWSLKLLWAPFVDKFGASSHFGRYRSWLFITHPLLLGTLLLGTLVDVPFLIVHDRAVGIPALILLSIVAATADTASHGLAVSLLAPEERGVGNGVQTAGMTFGTLLGGGLMVMMIDMMGWRLPLLIMAGATLLPLLGVLLYKEPPAPAAQAIDLRAVLSFFRGLRVLPWLAVLAAFSLIPALPSVPFQALFVDHGMGLSEIGLLMGVLSSLAGLAGGAIAGFAVRDLGRQRAFYFSFLLAVASMVVATYIVTRPAPGRTLLYSSVGLVFFGMYLIATILRTLMMDRCRTLLASSDYTIQTSLMSFCGFAGSGIGGLLAARIGATKLFIGMPILMLGMLSMTSFLLGKREFEPAVMPQASAIPQAPSPPR